MGIPFNYGQNLREPLKIHFGGQANLFPSGLCQTKTALFTNKADLSSLPELKNLLLAAQKQLLELPLIKSIRQSLYYQISIKYTTLIWENIQSSKPSVGFSTGFFNG